MRLYGIVGKENSEYRRMVFGHFTTKELAEAGYKHLPVGLQKKQRLCLLAWRLTRLDYLTELSI